MSVEITTWKLLMAKIFRSFIGRQRFSMRVFGWRQEVMRP
jgi:hypothetical protein